MRGKDAEASRYRTWPRNRHIERENAEAMVAIEHANDDSVEGAEPRNPALF